MPTERDRERAAAWHAANPERVLEHKRAYRKRNPEKQREYAMRSHRRKAELAAGRPAPDKCEVCGGEEGPRKRRMHFDHCHVTGAFRGYLCARCNMTLGQVKDDFGLLMKLALYLAKAPGAPS